MLDRTAHEVGKCLNVEIFLAPLAHCAVNEHTLPAAGGERVDHDDLRLRVLRAQVLRRDARGLISRGKCARKADAQNILACGQRRCHRVGELADVDRRSRAVHAVGDLLKEGLRRHIRMVGRIKIGLALHRKRKRQNGNAQFVDLLLVQATAAVGHDDIITHGVFSFPGGHFCLPFSGFRNDLLYQISLYRANAPSSHFPTQKRSKMRATMSSRAVRPVSSPRAVCACSTSVSTTSGVMPPSSASFAARTLSSARRTASA